jgi:Fic family protein
MPANGVSASAAFSCLVSKSSEQFRSGQKMQRRDFESAAYANFATPANRGTCSLSELESIEDPFEQAFFVMVHLPYLQPFDDVNKRVSRLSANIPFIKNNLCPLSFTDVPRDIYTGAVLGVYELNRIELLRDVFIWAYERSAARYAAVRQSLGEPDPFRLKYRDALREVVGAVVRARMDRKSAFGEIQTFAKQKIDTNDQAKFQEMAETELLGLHEGNFARYQITPREFAAWHQVWAPKNATP